MPNLEEFGQCPECNGPVKRAWDDSGHVSDFFYCTESCLGQNRFFITFTAKDVIIPTFDRPIELWDDEEKDDDSDAYHPEYRAGFKQGYRDCYLDFKTKIETAQRLDTR